MGNLLSGLWEAVRNCCSQTLPVSYRHIHRENCLLCSKPTRIRPQRTVNPGNWVDPARPVFILLPTGWFRMILGASVLTHSFLQFPSRATIYMMFRSAANMQGASHSQDRIPGQRG